MNTEEKQKVMLCELCDKPKEPEAEKYCHYCNGLESI